MPGLNIFRYLTLTCTVMCLAGTTLAQGVVSVTDFRDGPGNGVYSFASTTPATVMELVQSQRPRPPAVGQGELLLPADAAGTSKMPAVVLVHGSGGVYPEEVTFWAKLLNSQGIAAFVLDVFGPRGVKSTAEDQGQVPYAADTADAFAALGLLASHPRIDPKRIAVMGFSRGGVAALSSGAQRIISGSAPQGQRFAAHLALYSGGCTGRLAVMPKPGAFGPEPMLFVHGDADDYTYISDCRSYAQRIAAAGTPTEFVVIPGARHKFDLDNPRRVNQPNNPKAKEGCPLEFDIIDLRTRDRRSGEIVQPDQIQAINRDLCVDKGATVEGDRKARDTAGKAVVDFLNRVLKG